MGKHNISALNVAFLYVGTLMGAGFASGREIWQFFSVFGNNSYGAVLVVTVFFIVFGLMTVKISNTLNTTDIGKVIMPFENKYLEDFFGYVTAGILFTAYIVMAAAGGALFQEQFGFHKVVGGVILMLMVIATTLGGFERISKNFKYIIPILLVIVFFVCLNIIFRDLTPSAIEPEIIISPMAPSWYTAAVVYISYNMLGGVPILSNSTYRAKTYKTALIGAIIGGLLLGLSALIMNLAMLTDLGLSSVSVLPILALSDKMSPVIVWVYAILLLFAVYSSATSNFYGFTTKIKDSSKKKMIIIAAAAIGFLLSLIGFTNIIAFVFPLEGYFGIIFLICLTINYIRIVTGNRSIKLIDKRFQFKGDIKRVTAGDGGEALLITGSEKAAVLDCGMAYCGEELVENIKRELGSRPLDYAILTHTHYDHVAGLPYLKKEWPELISIGAEYGKEILEKPTALKRIEELSRIAWQKYRGSAMSDEEELCILMEGLSIDQVVKDYDRISLGDKELLVLETPGHTSCSLTFVLEPDSIIFPSESIGVLKEKDGTMTSPILKSYHEVISSIEKCRNVGANYIISPHYGMVPEEFVHSYWDIAAATAEEVKDLVLNLKANGASNEEILNEFTDKYFRGSTIKQQPKEAFTINAITIINTILKEFF